MATAYGTSMQQLPGVGTKRAESYARLGVHTVLELLRYFPRTYEDWSAIVSLREAAAAGTPCPVKVTALAAPAERLVRQGMTLYQFVGYDGEQQVQVTLFNNKYLAARIHAGEDYLLFGTVSCPVRRLEMTSPLIEPAQGSARIRPVYRQTEGLTSRMIETNVTAALARTGAELDMDPLPLSLRQEYKLCTRRYALENIHFPTDREALAAARRRLVFEELFLLQIGLLALKSRNRLKTGVSIKGDYTAAFFSQLPFAPTNAQRRVLAECMADMRGGFPLSRLLQGDVGSGKTAVAAGVAYAAIQEGWQVAMMAPTEILAQQHVSSLTSLLGEGIRVGLLTGSRTAAQKKETLAALAAGDIQLVIGTHALLSEQVVFHRLGLVITDEQHRFGVAQRATLAAKGINPHLLVMSATPIPRTLALILYGDLDVSLLDEMPPGRMPVATYAVDTGKRERVYAYIRKHVRAGRQVYMVCPLVDEGESDLVSATAYARTLAEGALRGYSVGLLHGRMKSAEKEQVMGAFSRGELSVLVSTTVIEVGMDVPNAVLMVIENAERFGLAQLHQLRGRVGRGVHKSTCILISDAQNEEAIRRLHILCETNDGFRLADEDLQLRGPGDFFGNRQHGLPDLKIADLQGDLPLFKEAQSAARLLLEQDFELKQEENRLLAAEVERLFGRALL